MTSYHLMAKASLTAWKAVSTIRPLGNQHIMKLSGAITQIKIRLTKWSLVHSAN
jgi:hypothetical protein